MGVSLRFESAVIGVGETLRLTDAAEYRYSTSNKKIAAVSAAGVVKGVKKGTAKITVSTEDGASAVCTVKVVKAPTSIKLSAKTVTLGYDAESGAGTAYQPKVTLTSGSASAITYTGYDAKVVSVDEDGLIVAAGVGKTTVTAKTFNGKKASVAVTVLPGPEAVTLEQHGLAVGQGDAVQLAASIPAGTASSFAFTSDNPDAASVDPETGVVRAVGVGEAVVTVRTFNGREDACAVRVVPEPDGVALSAENRLLGVKESFTLGAIPTRSDAETAGSVAYKTSNKKIATVSAAGVVKGVKAGTAKITATAYNGASAVCTVKVVKAPTSIKLSAKTVTLGYDAESGAGTAYQPKVTLTSGSASAITYTGYDAKVVSVDEDGLIVAAGVGKTTVTAKTFNGKKASVAVTVLPGPEAVTLEQHGLAVGQGDAVQLAATIPAGTASSFVFSSDNPDAASVDPETGVVRAVGVGEAVVTVRTFNGREDACAVQVVPEPDAMALSVDGKALGVGESFTLGAIPTRSDGAETAGSVAYKTSNKKIATVSAAGVVKGVKAGTVKITATAYNGVSAVCTVKVVKAPTSIKLSAPRTVLGYDAALSLGESVTLSAKLSPAASASELAYSDYDPAVVTVGADGLVTAAGVGKTSVTAKTYNGKKVSVTVTVLPGPASVEASEAAITLGAGATRAIGARLSDGTASAIDWRSDAPDVVSVDGDGRVTAIAPGEAVIEAAAFNGASALCAVTVVPAPESLEASPERLTLGVGETSAPIEARVDSPYGGITFATGSAKIAKVGADGAVTGVAKGSTTVQVRTYNGLTVSVPVTVSAAPASVSLSAKSLTLDLGAAAALTASLPKGTASALTFDSDAPDVAEVDGEGGVRAVGLGSAAITVRTFNGRTARCDVRVVAPAASVEMPESLDAVASLYAELPILALDAAGEPYAGEVRVTVEPAGFGVYADGRLLVNRAGTGTVTAEAGGVTRACAVTAVSYRSVNPILSIAHRGGSGYWPENTLEAFRNAASKGADAVELDARSTKDGVQVVFHDSSFTVGKTKYVIANYTCAQLKKLLPSLCTLEEALDVIRESGLDLHLELKNNADGAKCVQAVRAHGMRERTVYFSFYEPQLSQVRAAEPDATLGMSLNAGTPPDSAAVFRKVDALNISFFVAHKDMMTQEVTDFWHSLGLKICVWTPNTREEVARLCGLGVDFILSDYPDYCVQLR